MGCEVLSIDDFLLMRGKQRRARRCDEQREVREADCPWSTAIDYRVAAAAR